MMLREASKHRLTHVNFDISFETMEVTKSY